MSRLRLLCPCPDLQREPSFRLFLPLLPILFFYYLFSLVLFVYLSCMCLSNTLLLRLGFIGNVEYCGKCVPFWCYIHYYMGGMLSRVGGIQYEGGEIHTSTIHGLVGWMGVRTRADSQRNYFIY
ncbi:hypothetical protein B0J18DRAFT_432636 [Chaetomium sp. MPI-SDFR-AT-0129]|nr:hypothetical protein B0J18DRAFT_432636 [Chaetomium sp. MPI-SDFR-AT-0129]